MTEDEVVHAATPLTFARVAAWRGVNPVAKVGARFNLPGLPGHFHIARQTTRGGRTGVFHNGSRRHGRALDVVQFGDVVLGTAPGGSLPYVAQLVAAERAERQTGSAGLSAAQHLVTTDPSPSSRSGADPRLMAIEQRIVGPHVDLHALGEQRAELLRHAGCGDVHAVDHARQLETIWSAVGPQGRAADAWTLRATADGRPTDTLGLWRLPSGLRGIVVAPPGRALLLLDVAGACPRAVGALSGEPTLAGCAASRDEWSALRDHFVAVGELVPGVSRNGMKSILFRGGGLHSARRDGRLRRMFPVASAWRDELDRHALASGRGIHGGQLSANASHALVARWIEDAIERVLSVSSAVFPIAVVGDAVLFETPEHNLCEGANWLRTELEQVPLVGIATVPVALHALVGRSWGQLVEVSRVLG
jgi:hypothetical protein